MYFVTMMSPQQFLDLASPISLEQLDASIDKKFNTGKGESGLKNELLKWDSELSIKGATAGLGRQPFLSIGYGSATNSSNIPMLKVGGHEGRHRARALQRLGIKQFPVVIEGKRSVIFDTEATYSDPAAKDISFDSLRVRDQSGKRFYDIGRTVGISKNNRPELRAMVDTATNPEMSQDIMFSKTDVPTGLEQTSVYLSGVKDDSKTFYSNFVDGFEKVKNLKTGDKIRVYDNSSKEELYQVALEFDVNGEFTKIEEFSKLWKSELESFYKEYNSLNELHQLLVKNGLSIKNPLTLNNWIKPDLALIPPAATPVPK